MTRGTVTDIIEPLQNRTSKAGKPYTAMKVNVLLDSGEVVSNLLAFDELTEGATVYLEKNESGYWSILNKKKAAEDAKHEEMMNAIRQLYAKVNGIEAAVRALNGQTIPNTALPASTVVGPVQKPTAQLTTQPTAQPAAPPTGPDLMRQKRDEYRTQQEQPDTIAPMNDGDDIDLSSIPF